MDPSVPPSPEPGPASEPGPVPPLVADQPATPEPPGRSGWRSWVIAAVVAALVAGGVGFFVARSSGSSSAVTTSSGSGANSNGAPFPGGGRPGARGTVTKIDGSDITVQTTDQSGATASTVVRTTGNTTYTKSDTGSVSDLQAGDNVIVMGASSNGSIAATSINDTGSMTFGRGGNGNGGQPPSGFSGEAPPNNGSFPNRPSGGQGGAPGQGGNFTIGQVTAVDGSTVTISSISGDDVTVTTNGSTTVTVMKSASLADITVGATITATGDSSNGVLTATTVRIGDTGFGGGFGGGGGEGGGFRRGRTPTDSNSSSQSGN